MPCGGQPAPDPRARGGQAWPNTGRPSLPRAMPRAGTDGEGAHADGCRRSPVRPPAKARVESPRARTRSVGRSSDSQTIDPTRVDWRTDRPLPAARHPVEPTEFVPGYRCGAVPASDRVPSCDARLSDRANRRTTRYAASRRLTHGLRAGMQQSAHCSRPRPGPTQVGKADTRPSTASGSSCYTRSTVWRGEEVDHPRSSHHPTLHISKHLFELAPGFVDT